MKSQGDDDFVDPVAMMRKFNAEGVRYLLIGSMAAAMHNAPFGSADWDFWIAGEDKARVYDILGRFGLQGQYDKTENRPMDVFTEDEGFKVDVFFVKAFSNEERHITVIFDDVYRRSVVKKDQKGDFSVRVPTLEDLMLMKKMLPTPRSEHVKQMEYLEALTNAKGKTNIKHRKKNESPEEG